MHHTRLHAQQCTSLARTCFVYVMRLGHENLVRQHAHRFVAVVIVYTRMITLLSLLQVRISDERGNVIAGHKVLDANITDIVSGPGLKFVVKGKIGPDGERCAAADVLVLHFMPCWSLKTELCFNSSGGKQPPSRPATWSLVLPCSVTREPGAAHHQP
jgi:hypothetical protein